MMYTEVDNILKKIPKIYLVNSYLWQFYEAITNIKLANTKLLFLGKTQTHKHTAHRLQS